MNNLTKKGCFFFYFLIMYYFFIILLNLLKIKTSKSFASFAMYLNMNVLQEIVSQEFHKVSQEFHNKSCETLRNSKNITNLIIIILTKKTCETLRNYFLIKTLIII